MRVAVRMPIRTACAAVAIAGACLQAPVAGAAAGPVTFKHPRAYDTITLPEGMKVEKVDGDGVMFQGKGDGWFRIDILPVKSNLELATTIPVATFTKVLPNAAPDGEPARDP